MKIVHVTYSYHPDAMGGVEIYVRGLVRALREHGIESVVCAPGKAPDAYVHGDIRVHRLGGWNGKQAIETGYEPEPDAARVFGPILDAERPSLVHVHALSHLVTYPLAREAKKRGIPLVFTYHECGGTCRRGTLRRFQASDCDGRMVETRCASCMLHAHGLPRAIASTVARVPVRVGRAVAQSGLRGRFWTAVRMRELVHRKISAARAFLAAADAIVAPTQWVRELLLANGVPAGKLHLSPLGVEDPPAGARPPASRPTEPRPLRLVALARIEERKGLHVLLEAFARAPGLDATLDVFAVRQLGDDDYAAALASRAAGDARIRIRPPIPHEDVVATLSAYHALAVPSQAIETGPLVVLEAFAAGIPVVGSDVRGISDLVAHERNGLLVPAHDAGAWALALDRLAAEPPLLARLAGGIARPRTMREVSAQMEALYGRLAEKALAA